MKRYWMALLVSGVLLAVSPPAFADEAACRAEVYERCMERVGHDRECEITAHDVCDSKGPSKVKEPPVKEVHPAQTSNCTVKYTKGPRYTTRRR